MNYLVYSVDDLSLSNQETFAYIFINYNSELLSYISSLKVYEKNNFDFSNKILNQMAIIIRLGKSSVPFVKKLSKSKSL